MPIAFLLLVVILLSGCGTLPATKPPPGRARPPLAAAGVRLWQDAAIFSPVKALIAGAAHHVEVEMYEFDRPDLERALAGAAAGGVAVRLLYDPSVRATVRTARAAAAQRIAVRAYPLDDRRHQIDHVKLLIADAAALVGGMNWGRSSSGNHDYALETHDPATLDALGRVFEHDWELAGGQATAAARLIPNVIETAPDASIREALLAAIATAAEIRAEVFVLTDRGVLAALGSAHRRGARVRVLLDPHQVDNAAALRILRSAGVEATYARVPPGAKLHAKVGLFGATLLVGSANWTASGLGVNHELDLRTDDGAAVAAFRERFESDWSAARA